MSEENKTSISHNIWFTSDLHIGHKNIIKHCPQRAIEGGFDPEDIVAHDRWIIEKWNNTVKKQDIVYINGDFIIQSRDYAVRILSQLKGKKHLILGNHDKACQNLDNFFESITQRKRVIFKKNNFDFMEEDFDVTIEHFAMLTWDCKHWGSCQCMGHSHGRLDDYNESSPDLRLDVGFDGRLANYNFISLKTLYNAFKTKANNKLFSEYVKEMKEKNMTV